MLRVVDLHQELTSGWLEQIAQKYPFPPYWWVPNVTKASQQAMMGKEVEQGLANHQAHLLGCVEGDALVGMAQMHRLDWDSDHFGMEVYRLDCLGVWGEPALSAERVRHLAQAVLERAEACGADTLQTWVPMDDIVVVQALEATGFRTMEVQVTWILDLAKTPIPDLTLDDGVRVRGFQPGDEDALTRLAGEAHAHQMPGRFHSDEHLPLEAVEGLYRQWMLNSISRELADHISVIESDGEIVGYASLKVQGDIDGLCNLRLAQLLLGAVRPEKRRRGLVTQAIVHNLKWLEGKADVVHVGTQVNNIAAQRAWAHLGFRPARSGPSMHLWLER